jgi:hypothetical protein
MANSKPIRIYEYFDHQGQSDQYVCSGHVDSEVFRDECQRTFAIRPKVVQHRWRRTRRIVRLDPDKKKRARGYITDVICPAGDPDAQEITIGLL